ncbi:LXG domain-containing protein [Bacillus swezeyi]|uniref:LXG domain-containing protein n=1 Tax=Bacillus swezeyi TaxID=1925020 RepID=UPI0021DF87C5|nr:LXG domain-containing protein [Bacillus swezeyi]
MDDFQGEGADNIKAFYRDQAGIVDHWLDLIDRQIQFLNRISDAVADTKLDGNTFIDGTFLIIRLTMSIKTPRQWFLTRKMI